MSNQTDHTIVRLRVPPELKKQIEESAENNNRSQSAEMVARLEGSFNINGTQPIYFPENSAKELNTILSLSFSTIIKNLILNGVSPEVISKSFPDAQVFKELIEVFKDKKK